MASHSKAQFSGTISPKKSLYKKLLKLSFCFQQDPHYILDSIFQSSQHIKCTKRDQIFEYCQRQQTPTNYVIGKMYALSFTNQTFLSKILGSIKKIPNKYKTRKDCWKAFKYLFTIKQIRSQIDTKLDLFQMTKSFSPDNSKVYTHVEDVIQKGNKKRVKFLLQKNYQMKLLERSIEKRAWNK